MCVIIQKYYFIWVLLLLLGCSFLENSGLLGICMDRYTHLGIEIENPFEKEKEEKEEKEELEEKDKKEVYFHILGKNTALNMAVCARQKAYFNNACNICIDVPCPPPRFAS